MDPVKEMAKKEVALVAPIVDIRMGDWADKNTWEIVFDPRATEAQKQAAFRAILDLRLPSTEEERQEMDPRVKLDNTKAALRKSPTTVITAQQLMDIGLL